MKRLLHFIAGILAAGAAGSVFRPSPPAPAMQAQWSLIADDVTATVYNAVASQCNADYWHTASMFALDTNDVLSHRIIAMERTMMAEYGISYGDIVRVEGTGVWDGLWQIQGTMNKRFAGQHKIDILVPKHVRKGKWNGVRIYVPANGPAREQAVREFLPV